MNHEFERAKLLSGILVVKKAKIELIRAGAQKAGSYEHALQSGPWLVEKSMPIAGLNALKQARRSLVATDGKVTGPSSRFPRRPSRKRRKSSPCPTCPAIGPCRMR